MKYLSDYRPRPQGKGCIKWLIRKRWKSISDDETLKKNQHFYLWFWMKIWFHKSPLINADLSGKIYVPQGEESATMSHSTVTPAPFRSDFEVGHLISMWKRPAFKIYNNVLRKKTFILRLSQLEICVSRLKIQKLTKEFSFQFK